MVVHDVIGYVFCLTALTGSRSSISHHIMPVLKQPVLFIGSYIYRQSILFSVDSILVIGNE